MRVYLGAIVKNMLREFWETNAALTPQKKVRIIFFNCCYFFQTNIYEYAKSHFEYKNRD